MVKATKKAAPKAKKQPKPKVIKTYKALSKKRPEKMAPQAAVILDVLGNGPLAREDLLKKLESKLETKQPAKVVLAFYQSRLVKDGYLSISK